MRFETLYKPYFIFRGKNSLDMGVIVTSMPDVYKPKRRVSTQEIPGRDGVLHVDEGTYENYNKVVECAVVERANLDGICAWLDGSGEAIFSTEPDKVYRVRVDNQISIGKMLQYFQKFQVTFDTYPFKYSVNAADDFVMLTKPSLLRNRGTVAAEPKIKIYGTGSVTLIINGKEYRLDGLQESVVLESEMMEVLDGAGVTYTPPDLGNDLFPRLEVGNNEISWTGNVEKIEIEPRWRWL